MSLFLLGHVSFFLSLSMSVPTKIALNFLPVHPGDVSEPASSIFKLGQDSQYGFKLGIQSGRIIGYGGTAEEVGRGWTSAGENCVVACPSEALQRCRKHAGDLHFSSL
jgi:hypothetical protein